MDSIKSLWGYISRLTRTNNLAIIIGMTYFILSSMLTILFFGHEYQIKELQVVVEEGRIASTKMRFYAELAEFAHMRTRLTSQIISTDDIFDQDEINQQLEIYAGKFAASNQKLMALTLTDIEIQALNECSHIVPIILPAQRKVVSLAMQGDELNRKKAAKILYETVFPGQNRLVDIFLNLIIQQQQYIDELAVQSKISLDNTEQEQVWLGSVILFLFVMISILLVRKVRVIQLELEQSQENLEIKVKDRTLDLITARNEAETANHAKSEFLSSMSHELRTPMNSILGFAQILEYDDEINEEQKDNVDEILKAGKHLLQLLNQVLDLSKVESGRVALSMEAINLQEVVNECVSIIKPVASQQGISITLGHIGNYFVQADKTRLRQILLNLLSNAIKYNCYQGHIKLDVSPVDSNTNIPEGIDNKIKIIITDTGSGIAEKYLKELFQPFNRLDVEGSDIEGTGIGLAITRNLVEIMNGQIGVDSQLNIGCQFWFELPRAYEKN